MSDFPGEMTKQSRVAPPRIMRSTRYSLTAHGRSAPFSMRLPTGKSSFENASGCILLPRPAAGIMPHISGLDPFRLASAPGRSRHFERSQQLPRAMLGSMLGQRALARGVADAGDFAIAELERGDN